MGERLTREQREGVGDKFEVDPESQTQATNGGTLMNDDLLTQSGSLKEGNEVGFKEGTPMEAK